ncbi:hypothetical protein Btru_036552 [Bulinus truncatus]|nr:hypothetical protein Btru_036552 [Bulinus truncatus]
MAFPRARLKRFNELDDNIPGVGSYNLACEQNGPIKDTELNRTRSLNRLDQSCRSGSDKGYLAQVESLQLKLKEAHEKVNSLDVLLTKTNKQKETLDKEHKILGQKLSLCNRNLQELEAKKDKLNKKYSELQKVNADLEKKKVIAEQDRDAFSLQLDSEKKSVFALQKERSSLQSKILKLESEIAELKTEKNNFSVAIAKLESVQAGLEKERNAISVCLEDEKLKSQKEILALRSSIVELQNEVTNSEAVKVKLNETINDLENIRVSLESDRDAISFCLDEEREKSQRESSLLQSTVLKLQDEITELKSEKINLTTTITELEHLKAILEKERDAATSSLKEERDHSQNESLSLQSTISKLQVEIEKLSSEQTKLTEDKNELETIKANLERERDENSSLLEEEKEKSLRERSLLQSTISKLQDESSELKSEKKKLSEDLSELINLKVIVEKERDVITSCLKEELVKLQEKFVLSQDAISKLTKEITELESEKIKLSEDMNELINLRVIAEKERDFISSCLKEEQVKSQEKLELSLSSISELRKGIKELETEKIKLTEVITELKDSTALLEKERNAAYICLDEEREKSQIECSALKSSVLRLQSIIKDSETEKVKLSEKFEELTNKCFTLEKDRDAISCQLELEKKEGSALKLSVLELQKQGKELETEKDALSNAMKDLQQKNVVLEEQILKEQDSATILIEVEKSKMQEEYASLQSLSCKLKSHIRELERQQTILSGNVLQLKQNNNELEDRKNALIKERDYLTSLLEDAQLAHVRTKDEMIKVQSELAKDVEALKIALESAEVSSQVNQRNHLAAVEDLENARHELSIKIEENNKVTHTLKHLETSLAGKDHQLEEYKLEVRMLAQKNEHIQAELIRAEKQKEEALCQQEEMKAHLSENWKLKFEELEKKIEPFREALDMFEVEKKILLDRDKYTHEQMEKLTKEAIKNMGHQNHRQKVKYVDNLKKENLTLHKKFQETQDELKRQLALIKKYKEKLERLEGTKDLQTPSKVRVPLKEENRL